MPVGELDAKSTDGIGLGTGRNLAYAEVYEVGAERILLERLAKQEAEHQTTFGGSRLYEHTVYQVVVLGVKPFVIDRVEMREYP